VEVISRKGELLATLSGVKEDVAAEIFHAIERRLMSGRRSPLDA